MFSSFVTNGFHDFGPRTQDAGQVSPFALGSSFALCRIAKIFCQFIQQVVPQVVVLHFSPSKHDRAFDAISLAQEFQSILSADIIIMHINLVGHFDLFDFRSFGIFADFLGFLFLHVSVFGVVHNFAHRRIRFFINENEVQSSHFFGFGEGVLATHDSETFVFSTSNWSDNTQFVLCDLVVHHRKILFHRRASLSSVVVSTHGHEQRPSS